MDKLKKILKVAIVAFIIFACMTALMSTLIMYTSFNEEWSQVGMLVIVTIVCIITSFLIGNLYNSRGIIVGLISSLIAIEFIFLLTQIVFFGEITDVIPNIFYLISVLFGTVGGIVGVNSNK